MAARPADGSRSRCRCSIPTTTTARSAPVPIRSIFTRTRLINLYEDKNAFYLRGRAQAAWRSRSMRDYLGHTSDHDSGDMNAYELALGTHGRSGEQFDIWQAVYGPVGADGYPAADLRQRDRRDRSQGRRVLDEHYDLRRSSRRDWATLGPKLQGKIHIYVGSADTYFLNDAVYLHGGLSEEQRRIPLRRRGEVRRPRRALLERRSDAAELPIRVCTTTRCICRRSWSGSKKTAPAGADLTSWRY